MENREQNPRVAKVYGTGSGMPVLNVKTELLLRELYSLPAEDIRDKILDVDDPKALIQGLPYEDFFWLLKKTGEDDSLPLLELASADQWQYLLDLELWKKDRLDVPHTSHWINLLQLANPRQLVRWLFSEAEYLAYYYFFKTLEVVIVNERDEVLDLPDGFFSLDGVFYIRVIVPEYQESMKNIIRVMVDEDFDRYQALFLGLAGVLPAEVEEKMYRLKNVRLAEHGFLPYEEAIAVYSPLDAAILKTKGVQTLPDVIFDEETCGLVPVIPLAQTETQNLFTDIVSGIRDPLFLERLRLEFAGLANQILSADGLILHDLDPLVEVCEKAARIVNLTIEMECGSSRLSAEKLLRSHSLVTLFRVGFGMVLKVKWEAELWLKRSWFYQQGLDPTFWGEHRGDTLKGLLAKKPQCYVGTGQTKEYKDFEWISDLRECLKVLRGLMVLDGLLEKLAESFLLKEDIMRSPELTYRPLLFNLWARRLLKMEPSFSEISLGQAKSFFSKLRDRSRKPPYKMSAFKRIFIRDFMSHTTNSDPKAAATLEEVLSQLWKEFQEEYEQVSLSDLDTRYSKFLTIEIP